MVTSPVCDDRLGAEMNKRRATIGAAILVLVDLALFFPVQEWFQEIQGHVERLGSLGPIAVSVAYVGLTVLLIPGSALTVASGTLFGLWQGVLVVTAGANAGALLSFALARTFLRNRVERWVQRDSRFVSLDRAIGQEDFKIVFLVRLSPVFPFTLLNYVLGVSAVRPASYVLASFLGMLPGTFLYVSIGVAARRALGGTDAVTGPLEEALYYVGLAAIFGIVFVITRLARKALGRHTGSAPVEAPPRLIDG